MSEEVQVVDPKRRINPIWLLPIIAGLLGIYMVVYTYMTEGPEITIVFSTAEGLAAGKTKIKARSVEIGTVDTIVLAEDLKHVVVTASIDATARTLLREDTQFWVVRARVGPGGISGLATILSGGYIELAPGEGDLGRNHFTGLDDVPVTPSGTSGLHLNLTSTRAGSVSTGDPVMFRGYRVGRVDSGELDIKAKQMHYGIFIDAPYDSLVTEGTRFWNASGLSLSAGTSGIDFEMNSLTSLIAGGVAFGVPDGTDPGAPAKNDAEFQLFANERSTSLESYQHYAQFVARFDQSLRGLMPGAPVEYRGIRVGTVDRLMYKDLLARQESQVGQKLPVLLRLEPGRLGLGDTDEAARHLLDTLTTAAESGFRATLNSGNILTGTLYVGVDYYPDAEPASPGEFAGYPTIPTLSSGIARIEKQIGDLLARLNALPLDDTVANLNETLKQASAALDAVRRIAADDGMKKLPDQLEKTLAELRGTIESFSSDSTLYSDLERTTIQLNRTLQRLQDLAQKLEDQPNSIIFPSKSKPDPEPRVTP